MSGLLYGFFIEAMIAWRGMFDPIHAVFVRIAFSFLVAALVGETVHHYSQFPRIAGYALAGVVLGPLGLGWVDTADLPSMGPFVGLAVALLLFELGTHIHVRWLIQHPWVVVSSLLESFATFVATYLVTRVLGIETETGLVIAVMIMGSSPVIAMQTITENRARGRVSQRLLVLSGLNIAYSVLGFQLIMAWYQGAFHSQWLLGIGRFMMLVMGSLGLGVVLALSFKGLRSRFDLSVEHSAPLVLGLLLFIESLVLLFKWPVLLAPLIGGGLVKCWDQRPILLPRYVATLGSLLAIMLFVMAGSRLTWHYLWLGAGSAALLLLVRVLAKLLCVGALGPITGLDLRQSLALGVSLIPLAEVPMVELNDLHRFYPQADGVADAVVLCLVMVMVVLGPLALQWGLRFVRECRE